MRSRFASVAASCWLLLAGCSEETEPEHHAPVWGFVTSPDGPLAARVKAVSRDATVEADTETSGRYELLLPAGRYTLSVTKRDVLEAWFLSNGEFGRPDPDREVAQLDVSSGIHPIRLDARFARVDAVVHELGYWEGEELEARFAGVSATGTVQEGSVSFEFPVVPSGRHVLQVQEVFVPGVYDRDDADPTIVLPGERVSLQAELSPPAVLQGTLVDPHHLASEPLHYDLVPGGSQDLVPNQDGSFEIVAWSDSISFSIGGFGFSPELDGEARVLPLSRGQVSEVFPLVVPGIRVNPVGLDGYRIRYAVENEQGDILLQGEDGDLGPLVAGRWYLYAGHSVACQPSWIPGWYDRARNRERATAIDVSREVPVHEITFHLEPGARISGRILGLHSFVAAEVTAVGDDRRPICAVEADENDGFYTIAGLAAGSYRLQVEHRDVIYWYPGVVLEDDAATIEIQPGESREDVDMLWPGALAR